MAETPDAAEDGDWHVRHARTNGPDEESVSPVRIHTGPQDGDWHVRHGHVRRLAGESIVDR